MKKTCENCPDVTRCTESCKDLEELLEQPVEDSPERPVSHIVRPSSSGDEEDEAATIDDFIKIDPGRKFDDVADVDIDWTQTLRQPESADLNENEASVLMEAIRWAIPRDNPKLRHRFNSFLKCSKIVEVAKTANTTKQNIQKQFQLVIRRVHQIIRKSRQSYDYDPSPLKFKKKVTLI